MSGYENVTDYEKLTDEEIIESYRGGQEAAIDFICQKYKPLVRKKARSMYLAGGETDDLIQEGMLGLFKAIRDFEPQKQVTFYHFAQLCVMRQIQKAVEASNRKKNQPLNAYISISDAKEAEGTWTQELLSADAMVNPEQLLIDTENVRQMKERVMESLSPLEKSVLELYLQGYDYRAIAGILKRPDKGIDNAIQRIRQKVKKLL